MHRQQAIGHIKAALNAIWCEGREKDIQVYEKIIDMINYDLG